MHWFIQRYLFEQIKFFFFFCSWSVDKKASAPTMCPQKICFFCLFVFPLKYLRILKLNSENHWKLLTCKQEPGESCHGSNGSSWIDALSPWQWREMAVSPTTVGPDLYMWWLFGEEMPCVCTVQDLGQPLAGEYLGGITAKWRIMNKCNDSLN